MKTIDMLPVAETFDEHLRNIAAAAAALPDPVRNLACLLWSIERFDSLEAADDPIPAPLHIDLAKNIAADPEKADVLVDAIREAVGLGHATVGGSVQGD